MDEWRPKFLWVRDAIRGIPHLDQRWLANELYEYLLARVRYNKPGVEFTDDGHPIDCDIGQAVMGRNKASRAIFGSDSHSRRIRTAQTWLVKVRTIQTEVVLNGPTKVGTRVTLIGLKDFYTSTCNSRPTVPTNPRPTLDQPSTSNYTTNDQRSPAEPAPPEFFRSGSGSSPVSEPSAAGRGERPLSEAVRREIHDDIYGKRLGAQPAPLLRNAPHLGDPTRNRCEPGDGAAALKELAQMLVRGRE